MSNDDLVGFVSGELFWDPKVDGSTIAVSADDGRVTLRGTVSSLAEKREAAKAAERVFGVVSVDNKLEVSLFDDDGERTRMPRSGKTCSRRSCSTASCPSTVDAEVFDGIVTLSGTVEWRYQRDEAERVASTIVGVSEIVDSIVIVSSGPRAGEVADAIKAAFVRNAKLDADDLSVSSSDGRVTVEGVVSSWTEHNDALDAAWAAPGVTDVDGSRPGRVLARRHRVCGAGVRPRRTRPQPSPASLPQRIVNSADAAAAVGRDRERHADASASRLHRRPRPGSARGGA